MNRTKKTIAFLPILVLLLFQPAAAQSTSLGDTLNAFNAGILTPTPDRGLSGIVYADRYFWVTGFDPDDQYRHKLYKFNSSGTELVEYWNYGLEFAGWKGLAYDGDYLYVADVDTIRQIDPATGQKTGVKIPGPEYYLSGLTFDPARDHFWVSGDGNLIYEVDRQGNIVQSFPFITDLPASGLAWDTITAGGPYLWVWSMKYTPSDVRPKAIQMNPSNGTITGLEFEGVIMNPDSLAADYSLGATIVPDLVDDKLVLVGMHGSSYQQQNDQLDWAVWYDLDPEGTGIPGPVISVNPQGIQNDLYPGDSIDIAVSIDNLSDAFSLSWLATLEYPGITDTSAVMGDTLLAFDASVITPDTNTRLRDLVFLDDHIYVVSGTDFNDQFKLYKMNKSGDAVVQTYNFFTAFSGWTAMSADAQYIYGAEQYSITKFDPQSGTVVDNYLKTGFSPTAMAYDPQQELFYLGGGTGAIKVIDKQDNEINFYVTPYSIEGLSWDSWSPGGPYLWVSHMDEADSTMYITRLDPASGDPTGMTFTGLDLNGDAGDKDFPLDIFVTPDWQQNKLVCLALQESNTEAGDGHDKVVAYDLATTPPPGWIELLPVSYGTTSASGNDTLMVRMKAIMEDTLVVAQIVISSNDVLKPEVIIPVNFTMLGTSTAVADAELAHENEIYVYPNPARDVIYLEYRDTDGKADPAAIYRMDGKHVQAFSLDSGQKNTLNLDLPPGVYLLRILSESGVLQSRIIIR